MSSSGAVVLKKWQGTRKDRTTKEGDDGGLSTKDGGAGGKGRTDNRAVGGCTTGRRRRQRH